MNNPISELLLYDVTQFSIVKNVFNSLRKELVSIHKLIGSDQQIKDSIAKYNGIDLVIDISYLCCSPDKLQILGENIFNLLAEFNYEYICDNKYNVIAESELRFCFDRFISIHDRYAIVDSTNKITFQHKHRRIIDLNDFEFESFFSKFKESLYGHEKFKDDFYNILKSFRVFNALGEHKVLSLFLLGESGVGKTEVARAIYNGLRGKTSLAKVNFGNYSNEFSLSSLIGSARGYVGSDDGEIFIRVRNTDVGVILIDEFEKSNATLFNFFLDVLESGKMVSSQADELDINGFIIVFTSNISKEDFPKRISPELRSRFDYKGMFTRLYDEDKIKYIEFRVNNIIRKYNETFAGDLGFDVLEYILSHINVSQYHNMRDINKRIKTQFVKYIDEHKCKTTIKQSFDIKTLLSDILPE